MWINADEAHNHLCPQQLKTAGHCQANKCMAWRWHPHSNEDCVHMDQGYCGLAGPPQRMVLEGEREGVDYMMMVDREGPPVRSLGSDVAEPPQTAVRKHVIEILKGC